MKTLFEQYRKNFVPIRLVEYFTDSIFIFNYYIHVMLE